MTTETKITARTRAILTAREWVADNPLFLDTETTGLRGDAEICDIAVVDMSGNVILNTLVNPTRPIPQEASDIHHITDEMVVYAPGFGDVWPFLNFLINHTGRPVITYSAAFDMRLIYQSAKAADCVIITPPARCAMELYAEFYGEWDDYHGNYRYQKLINAAADCGIVFKASSAHRALADAQAAREIVLYMAIQKLEGE